MTKEQLQIGSISASALAATVENLTVSNAALEAENNKLRHSIAASDIDCIYCGLPKKDVLKCEHGFPGCGRADDLVKG